MSSLLLIAVYHLIDPTNRLKDKINVTGEKIKMDNDCSLLRPFINLFI